VLHRRLVYKLGRQWSQADIMFKLGRLKGPVAKMVAIDSTGRFVKHLVMPEKFACVVVNRSSTPSPPEAILVPVSLTSDGEGWSAVEPWRLTFKKLQRGGGEFAYACNPRCGLPHSWMLDGLWSYILAVEATRGAKRNHLLHGKSPTVLQMHHVGGMCQCFRPFKVEPPLPKVECNSLSWYCCQCLALVLGSAVNQDGRSSC